MAIPAHRREAVIGAYLSRILGCSILFSWAFYINAKLVVGARRLVLVLKTITNTSDQQDSCKK